MRNSRIILPSLTHLCLPPNTHTNHTPGLKLVWGTNVGSKYTARGRARASCSQTSKTNEGGKGGSVQQGRPHAQQCPSSPSPPGTCSPMGLRHPVIPPADAGGAGADSGTNSGHLTDRRSGSSGHGIPRLSPDLKRWGSTKGDWGSVTHTHAASHLPHLRKFQLWACLFHKP